ncbi:glycoside hydrolase family 2 protein [Paenibacillus sp. JX-17]|uniref:Beta-mannosidase n=1 Tax=Paenibacillus lacisoli TaxID=3064525 RepID=A0ABT9CBM0_9BACL|nr:glycoside hydrolase family 2 protein [Paenibacillus sp. JX-17]MDO7905948.1 glycoside hydrolase family 2 protein [Paenibacillus sp. JX-17]
MNHFTLQLGDWQFRAEDENEWLPAQVPGCVHTDLLRSGRIPDPFYGTNEKEIQWVDKKNWIYRTSFQLEEQQLSPQRIELVFDGLDTYADVSLNGEQILAADNMFRIWKVDAKPYLQKGANELVILFRSPIQEDLPKLEQLGYQLPATNDQSEVGGLGDKKVSIFARKAPYHYGWDWGPRFVTSGVWREARLEGRSGVQITDLFIRQDSVTAASAELTAIAEVAADAAGEAELKVSADGLEWTKVVQLQAGVQEVEVALRIEEPRLWWSRGLGEAHLYQFRAELQTGSSTSLFERTTGLRSARLIRQKDQAGASFYIELNGVPVFAKGANHIPNDSFTTEVTRERYRHEIASAAEANMNMLRVWGGGIYEEDDFYELCDEYGIMVWQDFMFACSMYPGDETFLNNVRAEAADNVRRLRNHPSIVLWCGNNEIDSAWAHYIENGGWGWKRDFTAEQRETIWADYQAVFHEILPKAVEQHAPGADYWPSSPLVSLSENAEQHAHPSTAEGDIHYWGVWHAVEPFENYNLHVGRFMSEYGFQSFPEYKSVRTYAEEEDMELLSDVMRAHQKNGEGNRLIREYMKMYLPEPKDFPAFLYMSQVLQAEAMKMAIEAHRRNKPHCMGTLYWQMNDCWPVASWAGMDYYGRWKALQYTAKRSFQDISVSIDGSSSGSVRIHVMNDTLTELNGILRLQVTGYDGKIKQETAYPVQSPANSAILVTVVQDDELLNGARPQEIVLTASLEAEGGVLDRKEHYMVPAKEMELPVPQLSLRPVEGSGGTRYEVTTDLLARQVWVSSEQEGYFSDNFFDLLPGEVKILEFKARSNGDQPFVPADPGPLVITSMADYIAASAASV